MPTPELLDFDSLVAPIPGDNPAGAGLDHKLRNDLDEARKTFDPKDYEEGSPQSNEPKREANWSAIFDLTKTTLAKKSKHLLYVARLLEALVMVHGFAGARDGFKFIRLLVEQGWDRLLPPLDEDGDASARIGQLNGLGGSTSGLLFPIKLRKVPMFVAPDGPLSWQSWKDNKSDYDAAVNTATTERCQQLVDDLDGAITELESLLSVVAEKSPNAPLEFADVSQALQDCLGLAREALKRKGGGIEQGAANDGATASGISVAGVTANREGIYRGIEKLAADLERLEPHSPVPLLLRKALTLGPMKFDELVEVLTRDGRVIDFIKTTRPDESE